MRVDSIGKAQKLFELVKKLDIQERARGVAAREQRWIAARDAMGANSRMCSIEFNNAQNVITRLAANRRVGERGLRALHAFLTATPPSQPVLMRDLKALLNHGFTHVLVDIDSYDATAKLSQLLPALRTHLGIQP
ncbi:MAG: hypothetical protein JWP52_1886 [Rhizobacter sp.]|nr:hypothetical protein [Rhizobacter sp.]